MKTRIQQALNLLPIGFCLLLPTFFTASPNALAQSDTVTISAADFQRLAYSAHLHTQLALKPELEASLQVLLELQRRSPEADPIALVAPLSGALQRYRSSAPICILTNGFRDEILAAYVDALRQADTNLLLYPASMALLNHFMFSSADYNPNLTPAQLFDPLIDAGNQRLLWSAGEGTKRKALLEDCVARAQANPTFAAAMDRLLLPETSVSLHDSPAQIIGNTNSPLHYNPTLTTLLALSQSSGNGSLTIASNQVMNLFTREMQSIWDTANTNLTVLMQINENQPDLMAYLTNQAARAADVELQTALHQQQVRTVASASAAVLVQSKLMPIDTDAAQAEEFVKALGGVVIGFGSLCAKDPSGLESMLSGSMDLFNMFNGTQSPEDMMAAQIQNIQIMIGDLSTNMNYRFDRVDQSLTTIFGEMNRQFDNITISFGHEGQQIAELHGDVKDIRSALGGLQTNFNRLERELFTDFNYSQRSDLDTEMNGALFYEIRNPNSGPMSWDRYSGIPDGPENWFLTHATSKATGLYSSPSSFASEDLAPSALQQQLAVRPLDANLNYIQQVLHTTLGQTTLGTPPFANPRDWFAGAYAYLQLAVENPMLFRKKGLTMPAMISVGENLIKFLGSLTSPGNNSNWPVCTALKNHYAATNLGPFYAKVSDTERRYANNTNFALSTWRQWDIAAPRVNATTTSVLLPRPKSLIAGGGLHSLVLRPDGRVIGWGGGGPGMSGGYNYGQTTIPASATNAATVATGWFHSLALKADGTVVGWGAGGPGMTGDPNYGQTTIPTSATNVIDVAAGHYHSLALRADGSVVGWGAGKAGTSGGPNVGQANVPSNATNIVGIAAGGYHSMALMADGTLLGWGSGSEGQLDIPATATNVIAIAAGHSHSLALRRDGTLIAWGNNKYLGADVGITNVPREATNIVAISAGGWHCLAQRADGTILAWGSSAYGQTNVPSGLTDVAAFSAGNLHSLVLKADGTVVGWGNNDQEQTVPRGWIGSRRVGNHIAAGSYHSLALKADAAVVGWGDNSSGQTNTPTNLSSVAALAAGSLHSLALQTDGTVVGWGAGGPGTTYQEGNGLNNRDQAKVPTGLSNVVAIAAGNLHSLALKAAGTVVGWGAGSPGTTYGKYSNSGQATIPTGLSNVVAIAGGGEHSLALKADGTVVGWGAGGPGTTFGVGYNNWDQTKIPSGLSNVVTIAAGYWHSLALKADGTVVGWGAGGPGTTYGNGCNVDQTKIPAGLSNVVSIAAAGWHSVALKADGTLVAWGNNVYHQTDIPDYATNVVAIVGGGFHSLALKADGTVLGWGAGSPGATTNLNYGQATIPTNVIDLAAWGEYPPGLWKAPSVSSPITAVTSGSAHCLALTAEGSVVAWGLNNWGQAIVPSQAQSGVKAVASGLGHNLALTANGAVLAWGLNDSRQTDVPVNAKSDVIDISAGSKFNLALKNDGTVVGWGLNSYGQTTMTNALGTNEVQGQIVAIAAGGEHALALRGDGTVVGWGDNDGGQATGIPAPGGSPGAFVTVGGQTLSGVVAIAAGRYHSLALTSGGRVVAWGLNSGGQCNVPTTAQSGVVAIAAGITHSLALKADGTAVVWGSGLPAFVYPQTWSNVVAIAAGDQHSMLLNAGSSSSAGGAPALSLAAARIPPRMVSMLRGVNDAVIADLRGPGSELYGSAVQLSGAKALLTAVLELGMPYTLENDGILRGFLYGKESLVDQATALVFLQAANSNLVANPDSKPQLLSEVANVRYLRFADRLNQCLTNMANAAATGHQPETPRLVGHTLRLLSLLKSAYASPTNSPPPALELVTVSNTPSLLLRGEPYASYALQYSDSLSIPNWTNPATASLRDGQAITLSFSGGRQRFYRTLTQMPP